jgi:hypothetical protein
LNDSTLRPQTLAGSGLGRAASFSDGTRSGDVHHSQWRRGGVRIQAQRRNGTMIKKVKKGYQVLSTKGKNLGGPYKTREEAVKRLRQVEFFKRQKP